MHLQQHAGASFAILGCFEQQSFNNQHINKAQPKYVKSPVMFLLHILVYFLTEGPQTDNSNYFISISCRLSMSCWKSKSLFPAEWRLSVKILITTVSGD